MAAAPATTDVRTAMEKEMVVPDVIPIAPPTLLQVKYGVTEVHLGTVFKPPMVAKEPTVTWIAQPEAFYTLCMTDPDSPSRNNPKDREYQHWLVANIPGTEIAKGDTITAYAGSTPPKGSGLHRYVFVLYKQPGKLKFDERRISKTSTENRAKFSISAFAMKHNLGEPVAGNYYQAEWSEI